MHDPIRFPMRYGNERDIEAAAFVAASFAYGRVGLFMPVIDRILSVMGEGPDGFLRQFDPARDGRRFSGIRYRFNTTDDIVCLLHMMGATLRKCGSLRDLFMGMLEKDAPDTGGAISGMMQAMLEVDTSPVYGRDIRPRGLAQFFPLPRGGSACKRTNLFLRWMVRDRDMDFGLWAAAGRHRLVIPLDTHLARVSRCLGLTKHRGTGWKAALEITTALRALDPDDPLKYDFALCHRGISGACAEANCPSCELRAYGILGNPELYAGKV
jgi:uncharacterized protein (TIGR02757 family)